MISRSIHVAANVINHSFFMDCLCVTHLHPLSVDGDLGCFHVLAVANNAATNIGVHVSYLFWFSLDTCPEVELLDHMVSLFLVF